MTKTQIWIGRILSGLVVAFLLVDAGMKVARNPYVLEASKQLGFGEAAVFGMGLALLVSTVLYVVPPTAPLGALLLTAYLGGAVATNLRAGTPVFSHLLFPVYFGVLAWAGLILRRPALRVLLKGHA